MSEATSAVTTGETTGETTRARPCPWLSLGALWLASAWLAAGALTKMVAGNPKDIPEIVLGLSPFGLDLTFHLVIAAELCLVCVALVKPRVGWATTTVVYTVFLGILVMLLAQGETSCGCAGGAIDIHPGVMLAIDGSLVAFLLATRPWRAIATKGGPAWLLGLLLVLGAATPWVYIDSAPGEQGELKRYTQLHEETWVGELIYDTKLAEYIPAELLPTDGKLVFYRSTCDHCASHLSDMAVNDDFSVPITLVRIKEKGDTEENRVVNVLPVHLAELELSDETDWLIETPYEVALEGGTVVSAGKVGE